MSQKCQQETSRGLATAASTARQVASSAVIIGNDRAETFPALTLKPCHLKLLDNTVVGWRSIGHYAWQRQIALNVLHAGRLLHHVIAGEVVTAVAQHILKHLGDSISTGSEVPILFSRRIVL